MKVKLIYICLLSLLSLKLISQENMPEEIILGLPDSNYPPYHIDSDKNSPDGIMLRPLQKIAEKYNIKLIYTYFPGSRLNRLIDQGEIHMRLKSAKWEDTPENFLWSEPVCTIDDILVYTPEDADFFQNNTIPKGALISARLGFIYPLFTEAFEEGTITRNDYYSNEEMLKSLLSDRSDLKMAAIISRDVALWIIREVPELKDKVILSDKPLDSAPYQYQMINTPAMEQFKKILDRELKEMKERGEIEDIFKTILSAPSAPPELYSLHIPIGRNSN